MTDREFVLAFMREVGKQSAEYFQQKSSTMTNDEIHGNEFKIPDFNPGKQYLNYKAGFICKAPSGNIVKLLQPYDSTIYTGEPETLPAQWGFVWANDPKYAKSFVELSTAPYAKGNVCVYEDHIWRSGMDNNVWPPGTANVPWEDLGPKANFQ